MVWSGCSKTASDELEVVHNNAARAVLGAPYRTSATLLRDRLGWSTLTQRRICHTAIWTYRCLKGYAPPYLGDLFVPTSKIHQRHTRQSNGLYIPRPKTNYLKRSFVYQGTLTWNSLPESMRIVSSLDAFKRSCIISFTLSSLLHLPLLSLVHMYSFTYFFVCILHVYRYVYKWSCIFHFIIYLFIILFIFCLCLCSTCVHVCVNGHGRAAFWLNGHDLTLNIEH